MATIRCSNGHEVSEEGNFCPVCGVRIREEPLAPHDEQAASIATPVATSIPQRSARRRTKIVLIGGGALLGLALLAAVLASSTNSSSDPSSAAPTKTTAAPAPVRVVTDFDGRSCSAKETKYGLCPGNPYFGKRPAAARRARHQAAAAKARRAAAARAREAARARAEAARIAAANAWHTGYYQQDENVYWKWVNGGSCQDFAQYGCWHVAVITRDGCSSYVAVNANEYQGGAIVNQLLDNQGYGIPAKTRRIFELDSDSSGNATAGDVTIDCS